MLDYLKFASRFIICTKRQRLKNTKDVHMHTCRERTWGPSEVPCWAHPGTEPADARTPRTNDFVQ